MSEYDKTQYVREDGSVKFGTAAKLFEIVKEKAVVKAATNLSAGQLVCNDGAGFVPATAALAALNAVSVVEHDHTYTNEENHEVAIYVRGVVVARKTNTVLYQGQKLTVSATAGSAAAATASDPVIGTAATDAAATDTFVVLRIGQ